eukprot:GEZU01034829.1.p2 GENE.GEZU01034829.1~~GEZU01034829.1.p2  ORF type:complete len:137 (+),score=20.80 GEZU01034829.1:51-413(+)
MSSLSIAVAADDASEATILLALYQIHCFLHRSIAGLTASLDQANLPFSAPLDESNGETMEMVRKTLAEAGEIMTLLGPPPSLDSKPCRASADVVTTSSSPTGSDSAKVKRSKSIFHRLKR